MPGARNEMRAAMVGGKIYVIGGNSQKMQDGKAVNVNDAGVNQVYDPATDTWRTLAPMPMGSNHPGVAALDGKIYVAGGFMGPGHMRPTDRVYAYDPATDTLARAGAAFEPARLAGACGAQRKNPRHQRTHGECGRRAARARGLRSRDQSLDTSGADTDGARPCRHRRRGRKDPCLCRAPHRRDHEQGGAARCLRSRDRSLDIGGIDADRRQQRQLRAISRDVVLFRRRVHWTTNAPSLSTRRSIRGPERWRRYAPLPAGRHASAAMAVGDKIYVIGGATSCGATGLMTDTLVFTLPP